MCETLPPLFDVSNPGTEPKSAPTCGKPGGPGGGDCACGRCGSGGPLPSLRETLRFYVEHLRWAPYLFHSVFMAVEEADGAARFVPGEAPEGHPQCGCGRPWCYGKGRTQPGKHPVHRGWDKMDGPPDLDRLLAQVEGYGERQVYRGRWEGVTPNIALHCGASGIVAIDIDPRNGGVEGLAALEAQHASLPRTVQDTSGNRLGGGHYLFRAPPPGVLPDLATIQLAPGVELLQGEHALIIPPSLHPHGRFYRWVNDPRDVEVAELPAWLIDLVQAKGREEEVEKAAAAGPTRSYSPPSAVDTSSHGHDLDRRIERGRAYLRSMGSPDPRPEHPMDASAHLYAGAAFLVGLDLDDSTALRLLAEWDAGNPYGPYPESEYRRKLADAGRRGLRGSRLDEMSPRQRAWHTLDGELPDDWRERFAEVEFVAPAVAPAVVRAFEPHEARRPVNEVADEVDREFRARAVASLIQQALQADAEGRRHAFEFLTEGQVHELTARDRSADLDNPFEPPCNCCYNIVLRERETFRPRLQVVRGERWTCANCAEYLTNRELLNAEWRFTDAARAAGTGYIWQRSCPYEGWSALSRRLNRRGIQCRRVWSVRERFWVVYLSRPLDPGESTIKVDEALDQLEVYLHDWAHAVADDHEYRPAEWEGKRHRPTSTSHGWKQAREKKEESRYERLGFAAPGITPRNIREAAAAEGATVRRTDSRGEGRTLRSYTFDRLAGRWDLDSSNRLAGHLFAGEVVPELDLAGADVILNE